jgi:hypothetical protein
MRLGDESYYKDRYLALKELDDRNFAPPDYLLFMNFISTYTSACMVGEFDWAEEYLKRRQNGIFPAGERDNALNYCRAFRAYKLKKYGNALDYFAKTNFKIFLMKVMVKSYTIRIYYEQNMHEQTFSAIDAFRHYLKSENLIAEEQKTAHYEFLKHLTELTKLKVNNNNNDVDLAILKKEIKNMSANPLGAKNWLIEKAEKFNIY